MTFTNWMNEIEKKLSDIEKRIKELELKSLK